MTNAELAILGLIAESPKHGYQIEQTIEARGMRDWTLIGFSSIYYIVNKLEKVGWLISNMDTDGDGPARKVYQLTKSGLSEFMKEVQKRLQSPRPHSGDFDLGLANAFILTPGDVLKLVGSNHQSLKERLAFVKRKQEIDRVNGIPNNVEILFDHSLTMMQAEVDWLDKLILRIKEQINDRES